MNMLFLLLNSFPVYIILDFLGLTLTWIPLKLTAILGKTVVSKFW